MKKFILILLIALLLCGCTAAEDVETTEATVMETSEAEGTVETTEEVDYSAPDFVMYDREGNAHSLSEFEGKPTILNFWASWCGPCKSEMPDLEAAYQEYGDEINFVVVNLTDGSTETVETAWAYIESQGYTFPVYYDTALDGANTYGISSIPITFFIDANGDLVTYYLGAMSEDILQQGIGFILEPVVE